MRRELGNSSLSEEKKKRLINKVAGLCPPPLKAQSVPKSGLQVGTEDVSTSANLGKGARDPHVCGISSSCL